MRLVFERKGVFNSICLEHYRLFVIGKDGAEDCSYLLVCNPNGVSDTEAYARGLSMIVTSGSQYEMGDLFQSIHVALLNGDSSFLVDGVGRG